MDLPTPEFLSHLKSLYPQPEGSSSSSLDNPWYTVAAVAFSASNLPEAVPLVFQHALADVAAESASPEGTDAALLVVRKIKDALFKSGLLSGYPKAINALVALHAVVPEKLQDDKPLRDITTSIEAFTRMGQQHFSQTYGENTASVQALLTKIYPDLEFFSTTFAYGYAYSFRSILSPVETSFTMIAALIASDTPRQIDWHLKGAQRNGASVAQVKAVRQISIAVAKSAGVSWRGDIPDI